MRLRTPELNGLCLTFFNKCSIIQWEWGCLGADNRGEGGFGKVDF